MNAALALHTAARRYCLEQHTLWCGRYAEIVREANRQHVGYHYTPEALATFSRYNVLNAIRVEIERMDPEKLGDLESVKTWLVLIGEAAEDESTRSTDEIAKRAMTDEREDFCRYIRVLMLPDLNAVEPLPYQRVLTDEESKLIWGSIRGRWQIPENYWYPLTDCALFDVVAFEARAFDEAIPHERLQGILAAHGIERVWELREYGPEYEQDVSLFEPYYNGAEGYWTSGDFDWIIYASHESSVTVAGWLLREVRAIWPSWQTQVWTGVFD